MSLISIGNIMLPSRLSILVVLWLTGASLCMADDYVNKAPKADNVVVATGFRYLSDTPGSAYEWLEQQQQRAYGERKSPPSLNDLKRVINTLPRRDGWEPAAEILKAVKLEDVVLPTRYEDIGAYFLTNNISESVRDAIKRKAHTGEIPVIRWGSLPIGEVNAAAQQIGSEHLVILNQGIFTFLYGALLTVNRTISIHDDGRRVAIDFSEESFRRMVSSKSQLTDDYSRELLSFAKRQAIPEIALANNHEAPLLSRQLNSVERFIVAHEFGHVLSGDTRRGSRMLNLPERTGGWRQVDSVALGWAQELRADATGLELGVLARTRDESGDLTAQIPLFETIAAYAPVLFLTIADALEDAIFCHGSGQGSEEMLPQEQIKILIEKATIARDSNKDPPSDDKDLSKLGCRLQSHPPAWIRAKLLETNIDQRFIHPPFNPPEDILLPKALITNARALANIVQARIQREMALVEK